MNSQKLACTLSLLSLVLASTNALSEECDLSIVRVEQAHGSGALNYDVFKLDALVKDFDVYVQRSDQGEQDCQAVLRIRPQGPTRLTNAGNSFLYYLLRPMARSSFNSQGVLTLPAKSIAADQQLKFSYQAVFEGGQFVAPGRYSDLLWLELATQNQLPGSFIDRRRSELQADVAPAARISFVGTQGRSQRVDFGELRDGAKVSPEPQILVQSTGQFSMSFSSRNRGVLRHQSGRAVWDIPYLSEIGGRSLPLAEAQTRLHYAQPTPSIGLRLPLGFWVPKVGDRPAGSYRDVIHVEISPSHL